MKKERKDVEKEELYKLFLAESTEKIKEIEAALTELKKKPDNEELAETISRAAHSVGGSLLTLGNFKAGYYASKLELIAKTKNINLISSLFDSLKEAMNNNNNNNNKLSPEERAREMKKIRELNEKLEKVEKDKNKAEEEIQLHSEIMQNISEGVYLIGLKDFKIKYTNPKFEKMFGYKPGEMIGKDVKIVNAPVPGMTPKQVRDNIVALLKKQKEWHGEVQNIKKDGTKFWCYANVSVFDHPEFGEVMVSVHRDITEEKKAGEKIKQEKEFSETVLSSIPNGIDIVDENLNIIHLNKTFLKIFGEKAIGKKCYHIYKDNKKQCEQCPLKKPIKVGETRAIITSGVAGGKTFKITHTGFKLPDGKKAILEFFEEIK